MSHVEVLVQVDFRRPDGLEEPHVLELKVDGLPADLAWERINHAVQSFLAEEERLRVEADRQIQAAEGPWCNHNWYDPATDCGYLCNLPPNHRGRHENFQTGRGWPQDPREESCA